MLCEKTTNTCLKKNCLDQIHEQFVTQTCESHVRSPLWYGKLRMAPVLKVVAEGDSLPPRIEA